MTMALSGSPRRKPPKPKQPKPVDNSKMHARLLEYFAKMCREEKFQLRSIVMQRGQEFSTWKTASDKP